MRTASLQSSHKPGPSTRGSCGGTASPSLSPNCALTEGGGDGPEFIATTVQQWLNDNRIKTIYIDPGSPGQNGYIESFHSRFRDECLSRELLLNLREARVVIADWRQHYNEDRPHSRLGYLSPEDFIHTKILTP